MRCINLQCEKRKICEHIYKMNGLDIDINDEIIIPDQLFYELNISNRLVKRGIPEEYEYGCIKLVKNEEGNAELYIYDNLVTKFTFTELVETANNAFNNLIKNGYIKIIE